MQYAFCKYCAHYIQHYGFAARGFFKLNYGHCTYPQIKDRKPDTPACPHYKCKVDGK